jgi:hypothetical protein
MFLIFNIPDHGEDPADKILNQIDAAIFQG